MSLRQIGPIKVTGHFDPGYQWTGSPDPSGAQPCSISGYLEWGQGDQLRELVNNRHRRTTIGTFEPGVIEPIWFDDSLLAAVRGLYLLQSCAVNATQENTVGNTPLPFTLNCVFLGGDRKAVVTPSARARVNDYGVTSKAIVADPYYGGSFVTSPGGTRIDREFDPLPHDVARVVSPAASMPVYIAPTAAVIECSLGGI